MTDNEQTTAALIAYHETMREAVPLLVGAVPVEAELVDRGDVDALLASFAATDVGLYRWLAATDRMLDRAADAIRRGW